MGKCREYTKLTAALGQMYSDLALYKHDIARMIKTGPEQNDRDMLIIKKCLCIATGELKRREYERIDSAIDAGMKERGEVDEG